MLFTDFEGPWVLNDFAYELCMAIFNNDRFYRNLSDYDDYLYYRLKKPGYGAGYTLKLILPFIAASKQSWVAEKIEPIYVPNAKEAARKISDVVVISTAYRKFVEKAASELGFTKIYASDVDFNIEIPENLRKEILESVDVIASLSSEELYSYLDRMFEKLWKISESFKVIGAKEKSRIVEELCKDFPIALGDSITDVEMFERARELGGFAVAFNGNRFALEHADVAIVSDSALLEAKVVSILEKHRNLGVLKGIENVYILNEENFESVLRESMKMRVRLRSSAGELG